MNFRPNSSDRFRARLAQREGIDFTPTAIAATYCQLFDSTLGGSGPTSKQTTQTTSGNARGVAGDKNQYVETGSIGVGQKGKYIESGALDLSGQKIAVGKGASLTINQAPQGTQPQSPVLAPVDVSGSGSTPPVTTGTGTTTPPATDATATTSTSFLDTLKGYWSNFSTWQKLGAGAVLVLILWLIFHKRR